MGRSHREFAGSGSRPEDCASTRLSHRAIPSPSKLRFSLPATWNCKSVASESIRRLPRLAGCRRPACCSSSWAKTIPPSIPAWWAKGRKRLVRLAKARLAQPPARRAPSIRKLEAKSLAKAQWPQSTSRPKARCPSRSVSGKRVASAPKPARVARTPAPRPGLAAKRASARSRVLRKAKPATLIASKAAGSVASWKKRPARISAWSPRLPWPRSAARRSRARSRIDIEKSSFRLNAE
jgi:hypothetical protein